MYYSAGIYKYWYNEFIFGCTIRHCIISVDIMGLFSYILLLNGWVGDLIILFSSIIRQGMYVLLV